MAHGRSSSMAIGRALNGALPRWVVEERVGLQRESAKGRVAAAENEYGERLA